MNKAIHRALLVVTAVSTAALSSAFTFTGDKIVGGYEYKAEATFSQSGNSLNIILKNNAAQVQNPGEVLTCLFFDVKGVNALTPVSASLGGGSNVVVDNVVVTPANYNLNKEWAYVGNMGANQWGGAKHGIGATGLSGTFGANDLFFGHVNARPGGVDFGIVPTTGTANQGGLNGRDFVNDTMLFSLSLPTGYVLDGKSISNVWFQYGTSPTEQTVAAVPEPASMTAIGLGIAGLLARRRRR